MYTQDGDLCVSVNWMYLDSYDRAEGYCSRLGNATIATLKSDADFRRVLWA